MPKHFRQKTYAEWSKRYGEDEMQRRRLAVVAEYQRIDGLRTNHG